MNTLSRRRVGARSISSQLTSLLVLQEVRTALVGPPGTFRMAGLDAYYLA